MVEPQTSTRWRDVFRWTPEQVQEEVHVYGGLALLAVAAGLCVLGAFRWEAGLWAGAVTLAWGAGLGVLGAGLFYLGVRT